MTLHPHRIIRAACVTWVLVMGACLLVAESWAAAERYEETLRKDGGFELAESRSGPTQWNQTLAPKSDATLQAQSDTLGRDRGFECCPLKSVQAVRKPRLWSTTVDSRKVGSTQGESLDEGGASWKDTRNKRSSVRYEKPLPSLADDSMNWGQQRKKGRLVSDEKRLRGLWRPGYSQTKHHQAGIKARRHLQVLATDKAIRCRVPVDLFHALIAAESSWRAYVVSSAGAVGLTQIKPYHGHHLLDLMDPETNLSLGACLLRRHFDRLKGWGLTDSRAWRMALAAYHAGQYRRRDGAGTMAYVEKISRKAGI